MTNIIIKNICKRYGNKQVLKDFNAELTSGKISCIMGESGCGKTTLLNIILGIEKADSGSISGVPERVSVVFQEDRLFDCFTVQRNIKAVLPSKSKVNVNELIYAMGLEGNEKALISQLSGGMKRRVAIARALAYEADFIVMDEPFKGIDDKTKQMITSYVKNVLQSKTVLIVTHDIEDIKALGADRVIEM